MIEQTLTPKNNIVDLSFEIPNNLVGKSLKVSIDFEKDDDNNEKQMTQEEFLQWIDEAEKAPTMSLETCNEKWEKKRQEILSRIR
jgi:hypothetical protein